jgi:plastocyanin
MQRRFITMKTLLRLRMALALICLLVMGGTLRAATRNVSMFDNFFSPAVTDINVGDTVRWENLGFNLHGTTSTSGAWDSEDFFPGGMDTFDTFSHTFNVAGDFPYFDAGFSSMTGLVRVVNANTPPTCSITNLTNGAVFVAPTNLAIRASAADPGGSVASVQFFVGGNSAGTTATSPYSVVTNGLPGGGYLLTAVATDNLGARGTSAPVSITVTVPIRFDTNRVRAVGNTFPLTISSTPGLRYALEGSLMVAPSNWVAIATNTAASNSMTFGSSMAGFTNYFFRARLVPNP